MRRALLLGAALLAAASMTASAIAADPAAAAEFKAGVFEPARMAPDFTLPGSNGSDLVLADFRGKVVLLGFGFSTCPDVCPTTLLTLASARKQLGELAADVQVLYVTVDPERDDADRLRRYLAVFDPSFIGGTGGEAQLRKVREDYGIMARKVMGAGDDYQVAHSAFVYLIDRRGRLRALMPYGHQAADFVHDLRILLAEP
jgi:protein SCO1/2